MADPIAVIVDKAELMRELQARVDRVDNVAPLLDAFGLSMVRSVQKTFREGGRPRKWDKSRRATETSGQTMRHKGELMRSITHVVRGNTVEIGTNLEYARIHQYGGTITPKRAKALTVPVHVKAYGKRAADFPDLVYIPRRGAGKDAILAMVKARKGKGGSLMRAGAQIIPYFVLKRSVKIPARPFLQILPEDTSRLDRLAEKYLSTGEVV